MSATVSAVLEDELWYNSVANLHFWLGLFWMWECVATALAVDDDGDLDVVAGTALNGFRWYESSGGLLPTFTTRALASGANQRSVFVIDIDRSVLHWRAFSFK
jgi:hypothetical protein